MNERKLGRDRPLLPLQPPFRDPNFRVFSHLTGGVLERRLPLLPKNRSSWVKQKPKKKKLYFCPSIYSSPTVPPRTRFPEPVPFGFFVFTTYLPFPIPFVVIIAIEPSSHHLLGPSQQWGRLLTSSSGSLFITMPCGRSMYTNPDLVQGGVLLVGRKVLTDIWLVPPKSTDGGSLL